MERFSRPRHCARAHTHESRETRIIVARVNRYHYLFSNKYKKKQEKDPRRVSRVSRIEQDSILQSQDSSSGLEILSFRSFDGSSRNFQFGSSRFHAKWNSRLSSIIIISSSSSARLFLDAAVFPDSGKRWLSTIDAAVSSSSSHVLFRDNGKVQAIVELSGVDVSQLLDRYLDRNASTDFAIIVRNVVVVRRVGTAGFFVVVLIVVIGGVCIAVFFLSLPELSLLPLLAVAVVLSRSRPIASYSSCREIFSCGLSASAFYNGDTHSSLRLLRNRSRAPTFASV